MLLWAVEVDEAGPLWSRSSAAAGAALWPSDSIAWKLASQTVAHPSLQKWQPESGEVTGVAVGSSSARQP